MTTTVASMLSFPSFVSSVRDLIAVLPNQGEALQRALVAPGSEQVPDGVERADWRRNVGTLRFLYEVASRESQAGVVADLLENESVSEVLQHHDVSGQRLSNLLATNDSIDERLRGERRRDGVLPTLTNARVVIDLRLLDRNDETEPALAVAPVVTVRMEFDEHVGGRDALAVQVPFEVLRDLVADLKDADRKAAGLSGRTGGFSIPAWALPEAPE